ncbi:MAG: ThuA domain-containing protein [Planctomycetaceae bacterium]
MMKLRSLGAIGVMLSLVASGFLATTSAVAADPVRVLIVDGQNNHNWKATTPIMKEFLTKSGRFTVDVVTTPPGKAPKEAWDAFRPKFSDYATVLSNYNGELWPEPVQRDLEAYVSGGGGLVIVHAANNAFPEWAEFNKMIGLGWRGAGYGNRVTVTADGKVVETAKGEGPGAGHGSQHDFSVVVRDREHPVMKGIPAEWKHVKDELYHGQRGPAASMHILATAFSAKQTGGTDAHEPMVWWIPYGKGKVFTTVLGHADYSMKCIGFQTIVNRGTEWTATGQVTIPVPEKFPTATETLSTEEKK